MADNKLDALVFPHQTIPSSLISGIVEPDVQNRPTRGWNGITDISGLPAIVVPAGFTREVIDRDPNNKDHFLPAKQVELPVGLTFLGRPYDEATLLEVASGHRRSPKESGELPVQHKH
jgi:amidase